MVLEKFHNSRLLLFFFFLKYRGTKPLVSLNIEYPNVIALSGKEIDLHSLQPSDAQVQIYGISFTEERKPFLFFQHSLRNLRKRENKLFSLTSDINSGAK